MKLARKMERRFLKNQKQSYRVSMEPTPGHVLVGDKTTNLKRYMYPSFHSSILDNCQGMKAMKEAISRRMDKEGLACVCVCVCVCVNEILPLTTLGDLEISWTEKNKILQVSRICEI